MYSYFLGTSTPTKTETTSTEPIPDAPAYFFGSPTVVGIANELIAPLTEETKTQSIPETKEASTQANPTSDYPRVIEQVPRSRWVKIKEYDPSIPVVQQIQECEETGEFTRLRVRNILYTIYIDTDVPYENTEYTLVAHHLNNQVCFKNITEGTKYSSTGYRMYFDFAKDLDRFIKTISWKGEISFKKPKRSFWNWYMDKIEGLFQ